MSDEVDHEWEALQDREAREDGADGAEKEANDKICKYCRKGGFHWEELPEGWRLVSAKGEIHKCFNKPVKRL